MPQPGDLDQRVVFQAKTRTPDGGGGFVDTWSNIGATPEVWAKVWPVSGRERVEGQQIESPTMYRFRIRNRSDLTTAMRVVWRGRAHNIRFIADPGPRALYLDIDAEAGVAI